MNFVFNHGASLARTYTGVWALLAQKLPPPSGKLEDVAIVELDANGVPMLPAPYRALPAGTGIVARVQAPNWQEAQSLMRSWFKAHPTAWDVATLLIFKPIFAPFDIPSRPKSNVVPFSP